MSEQYYSGRVRGGDHISTEGRLCMRVCVHGRMMRIMAKKTMQCGQLIGDYDEEASVLNNAVVGRGARKR